MWSMTSPARWSSLQMSARMARISSRSGALLWSNNRAASALRRIAPSGRLSSCASPEASWAMVDTRPACARSACRRSISAASCEVVQTQRPRSAASAARVICWSRSRRSSVSLAARSTSSHDLLDWIESRRRRDTIPGRTAVFSLPSSVLPFPDPKSTGRHSTPGRSSAGASTSVAIQSARDDVRASVPPLPASAAKTRS